MGGSDIRRTLSAARILLICPDCAHENAESAEKLRGMSTYYCNGDGCDYIFDLAGPRRDIGGGIAQAWRTICAAFYAMRRQGFR
jgi:hypothetical protein